MFSWIRKRRAWRREHLEAFEPALQKESDGLTLFQHQALKSVAAFVDADRFKRIEMTKEDGAYLVAPLLNDGAEIYIYPDGAGVSGANLDSRFEEWDYRTPRELIEALVQTCAELSAQ